MKRSEEKNSSAWPAASRRVLSEQIKIQEKNLLIEICIAERYIYIYIYISVLCKVSDQEFDDDIASINSKDYDDDADNDDD